MNDFDETPLGHLFSSLSASNPSKHAWLEDDLVPRDPEVEAEARAKLPPHWRCPKCDKAIDKLDGEWEVFGADGESPEDAAVRRERMIMMCVRMQHEMGHVYDDLMVSRRRSST